MKKIIIVRYETIDGLGYISHDIQEKRLSLVVNNTVVFSATKNRPYNYSRLKNKIKKPIMIMFDCNCNGKTKIKSL